MSDELNLFALCADAVASQKAPKDSGTRQVTGRYELEAIGGESRIAELAAEYELSPRPAVVAKVNGMIFDAQHADNGKGLSVYATGTVSTRGFTL